MTYTSCIVVPRNQNGVTVQLDAAPSTGDSQPFADAADLHFPVPLVNNYATFEPDFWLLDGSIKLLPDAELEGTFLGDYVIDDVLGVVGGVVHVGWMTETQTDAAGESADVVLTFFWLSDQDTTGLTLYFGRETNDYPVDITVTFLNSVPTVIQTNNYTPTSSTFSTGQAVNNFRTIVITFRETNKPFRYYRLTGIDFDEMIRFTDANITNARLVEQIDLVSFELPFNTFNFDLISDEGDFSIVEPAGFYATLQYRDPFDVFEAWEHEYLYMGRFYLNEWESKSANIATLRLIDLVGVLDKIIYLGEVNPPATRDAWDMMQDIMEDAGITFSFSDSRFNMDAGLQSDIIIGYFPTASCRDSLQILSMTIGGYATCARNTALWIHEVELASDLVAWDFTLTGADKGIESPVSLRTLVTGVEVTAHNYSQQIVGVLDDLFDGDVGTGDTLIIFGKPIYGEDHTTGTTVTATYESSGTYLLAHVTVAGHLRSRGFEYVDGKKTFSQYNLSLPAGTDPNILRIDDATTVSPVNAQTVTDLIYDYFQQRYLLKTKLFAPLVAPGDSVLIDVHGRQLGGIVEKMTTNLTGGMTSDVEIIGVIVPE